MGQTTIKGLPVFAAELDEDCGMTRIALVDFPAVERDFLAFADEPQRMQFAVADEDKRLIHGVVMRANFPIYRYDEQMGGYFILYRPETLRRMAEKYLTEGRANNIDLMHDGKEVEGVAMTQFYIKDRTKGIVPAGFEDVEDGSLFAEFHVTNDEIWQGVKDGTFKGFSIETLNIITPATGVVSEDKIDKSLLEALSNFIQENNMTEKFKSALAAFMEVMGAETATEQKFGAVTTDKAVLHWEGDNDLTEGDAVFVEDENGERRPVEDGDYTTEDGKVIRVVNGVVSAIVDDRAEVSEEGEQQQMEEAVARMASEADALRKENEALRKEIAELKAKPAAAPAHDEFREDGVAKTGNARFDRLQEFGKALRK